ncbi:DUF4844 domain-containing protein [Phenylobacterium sp.]|uniref:DUF4844 domain-containing protein n=1 Tax=Phenylobacterium sp. TaxID=1871053 RepID=UPI0025F592B8|nr:DUF4844 domain-containing protein [Phenylobacterium sp.]
MGVVAATLIILLGARLSPFSGLFPTPSTEVVAFTAEKRQLLRRLRGEAKFGPHDYPPLGYTGAETPEDRVRATAAVDRVIDAVLAEQGSTLRGEVVSREIGGALRSVRGLATEDRDRTADYLLEVWYILGFKGPTGRLSHGAGFVRAPGYAEPLPPGWTAPEKPRPIG